MKFKTSKCGFFQLSEQGYTVAKYFVDGVKTYAAWAPQVTDALCYSKDASRCRLACEKHFKEGNNHGR